MRRIGQFVALAVLGTWVTNAQPLAADECCGSTAYRLTYETIYEQQPVTTYRLQYETVWQQQQVVSQRPVWETEMRTRTYRVAKPVLETAEREERYTVLRPVWETTYRDYSYDRVRYVSETATRQERRIVNKPVWETQMRQQQVVVQRPVTETVVHDRVQTVYQPVTTARAQLVDQGQLMDQWTYMPGTARNRLRWLPASVYTNPTTGQCSGSAAGCIGFPIRRETCTKGRRSMCPTWCSNRCSRHRYVPQTVVEKVPVQVTRMQQEVEVRQYPVQVYRVEQHEEVTEVPYTVQRPVTERVEQKVPVQVCRWEQQENGAQGPRFHLSLRVRRPSGAVSGPSLQDGHRGKNSADTAHGCQVGALHDHAHRTADRDDEGAVGLRLQPAGDKLLDRRARGTGNGDT